MANRMKEDEKNERILRNLLKLPENRRCINCNSLVPQYVCTNFSTFVCTTCSGIHREFTHRMKSVSMAKFTPQEIRALQGRGNASAREIYLKEWDPQRNSLPDVSNIERLRDFIKHVYVNRRYTGEKNLEKPLRANMGETEDFNGNRKIDTQKGGSRSPSYDYTTERRYGDRSSSGGKSPAYDQDDWKNTDHKSSPARAEVVNDWRREDRFGNRRRSEDRSSDGSSKLEVRSPDSQRDSDISSPPIVRPVRDILGDSVSPLRIIEPPKATGGRSADGWVHTQRTASSSSLASSDTNPSENKVEASFIDFDSVPDPPIVSQAQQAAPGASSVQLTASSGEDWANFDSAPGVNKYPQPSNSVESVLSELVTPAPTSSLPAPVGKLPPLQSSAPQVSSFGPFFGNATPPLEVPSGGVPGASFGPAPQLANVEASMLTHAASGGQWPAMNPQHHFVLPGGIGQPSSQLVTPIIGGSSSNKPWNPLVPNAHGPPGISAVGVGQNESQHAMATSFGVITESSLDARSGGRKALPEDLFAMNYSYAPSPVPGWYSGSPHVAAVPMQYNTPVAAPNIYPISRSINPFDVGSEQSPAQAPTFPSVASLQGALPGTTPAGLLRTSSLETSQFHPSPMLTQAPAAYGSAFPPSSFVGQGVAGSMAPRPQGQSGFPVEESAFASLNPNPQLGGLHPPPPASSNFTSTSGNPFG